MAHNWARWLHHPCRLGGPHRFRAGRRMRSGPPAAWGFPTASERGAESEVAHLPPVGSPPLQSGGQNQKWPTSGQGGYITPAARGFPTALERGAKSEVAHKWARWLHNPCRLGGFPPLQSGGQNHRWPTSGQGGYITPAAWGVPTASDRWAESEVAHKWARWLYNPCRLGGPNRFRAGGSISGGPQVGKVATS